MGLQLRERDPQGSRSFCLALLRSERLASASDGSTARTRSISYNTRGNRHCGTCQSLARPAWIGGTDWRADSRSPPERAIPDRLNDGSGGSEGTRAGGTEYQKTVVRNTAWQTTPGGFLRAQSQVSWLGSRFIWDQGSWWHVSLLEALRTYLNRQLPNSDVFIALTDACAEPPCSIDMNNRTRHGTRHSKLPASSMLPLPL
jgi:hypothetical protein